MERLRPYRAILLMKLRRETQYRFSFFSRVSTNIFWGYVRAVIVWVYYAHAAPAGAGLSMAQAVSMVWLGQIALNLAPGFGVDAGVWERIRSGDVAAELVRPLDLYGYWFSSAVAAKIGPFLLAIVPVGAAALLVPGGLGLAMPVSVAGLMACLATLATGVLVASAAVCLTYAMLLDVRWGEGPSDAANTVMQILAGGYLPLQLWPDSAQPFLRWQPFAYLMDVPLRFYVGSAPLADVPRVLLVQAGWTLALVWMGRAWIGRSLRRLVIQGG